MGANEYKLYTPHAKQKQIHVSCSEKQENFWTIVVSGRQAGKSMAAKNQALYWAIKNPGCKIWYITPVESQAISVYTDIFMALSGTGLIKSKKASKGQIEIKLTNGSLIEFKSASSENSLRGASVNYCIIDEAAFIKKETIEQVIVPVLTAAGKKGLILSTPKGKNWFYQYYLRGLDKNNKDYKSFKFLSTDNPSANLSLIEMFKESMPPAVFEQEFLGMFVDSAAVFRNIEQACTIKNPPLAPEPGRYYYCGIDVGMISDDTVVTILDDRGEMVYMDVFTGVEAPEMRDRILKTLNHWKPRRAVIEENNQGLPLYQEMRRTYPILESFVTTNKSKEEIINRLVAAFSGMEIKCFESETLIHQLNGFIFELTPTGKIRYCAANGFKDDCVMSLALVWNIYAEKKLNGGYSIYGAGMGPSDIKDKKTSKFKNDILNFGNEENFNGEDNNEYIFFS